MAVPEHNFGNAFLPPAIPSTHALLERLQIRVNAVQSNRDMLDMAVSQVERFGWTYLFEIPGCLFDQPAAGAAALAMKENTGRSRLMVLIADFATGVIQVIGEDGMSDKSLHFVDSYAGVLELLGTLSCGRVSDS